MSDIKLDDAGDLAIENNTLVLITGGDEVGQRLRQRLRTFRGEWFLNPEIGLPYREEIFVKRQNPTRIEAFFKREILGTPGVLALLEYSQTLDSAARSLEVSFTVKAYDGSVLLISEVI